MYAHQHFGDVVYDQLTPELRRRIEPHRDLYNIGLQGPDIFFYADPIFWGEIPQYGNRLHAQSGHEFFDKALALYDTACEVNGAQEATAVYLFGVICHYSLDSICHQYINEMDAEGVVTHAQLEGDFDRHRIEREGRDPVKEDISRGIHPSREAASAIEVIYPEADAEDVLKSIRGCVSFQHLVRCPHDFKRNLFYGVMKRIGKYKSLSPHIMRKEPDPDCTEMVRHLDELFDESVPKAVRMITQLDACLQPGAAPADRRAFLDSPDCDRNYEGEWCRSQMISDAAG